MASMQTHRSTASLYSTNTTRRTRARPHKTRVAPLDLNTAVEREEQYQQKQQTRAYGHHDYTQDSKEQDQLQTVVNTVSTPGKCCICMQDDTPTSNKMSIRLEAYDKHGTIQVVVFHYACRPEIWAQVRELQHKKAVYPICRGTYDEADTETRVVRISEPLI